MEFYKKILIVKYLPRDEKSRTKKLLDNLISNSKLKNNKNIEILDLVKNPPEFFLKENLYAYYKRNFKNKKLNENEINSIKNMDILTQQFKKSDLIIFAFPRYNFSMPGIIKTYFDTILQKGETWNSKKFIYKGLLKNKKILVLTSSGGIYSRFLFTKNKDNLKPLLKNLFKFIGVKNYKIIDAQGLDIFPKKTNQIINKNSIKAINFLKK